MLAALYIFLHAWQHLYARPELKSLDLGIIISLSSATINGILGYYLVSQGNPPIRLLFWLMASILS